MGKTLTIVGVLLAFPNGAALSAEDCFAPMAEWRPQAGVSRLAEENHWRVRRIQIHNGCYEIDGVDAEGRSVKATIHPATLRVLRLEYDAGAEQTGRAGRGAD